MSYQQNRNAQYPDFFTKTKEILIQINTITKITPFSTLQGEKQAILTK